MRLEPIETNLSNYFRAQLPFEIQIRLHFGRGAGEKNSRKFIHIIGLIAATAFNRHVTVSVLRLRETALSLLPPPPSPLSSVIVDLPKTVSNIPPADSSADFERSGAIIARRCSFRPLIASSGVNGSVTSTFHYERNYLQKRARGDGAYLARGISRSLRNIRRDTRFSRRVHAPACSRQSIDLSDRGNSRAEISSACGSVAMFAAGGGSAYRSASTQKGK